MKRLLVVILCMTCLWGGVSYAHDTTHQATLTRGPYLQSIDHDSAIIVWRTDNASDSLVEYGEIVYTQTISSTTPVTEHIVSLASLSPGTTYLYRISSDGSILHTASLSTAPAVGDLDFVMIGDSGTGSQAQYDVAAQMLALQPDFVLHLGDVIYPDGQPAGYDPYFFAPYRDLLDHAPIFPSLGNHDYNTANAQPYLDAFYLPGNEHYYSFDWGDAHFIALDTNQPYDSSSVMYQWLEADLAASTSAWKFVYFHHAIYTSGLHASDAYVIPLRDALAPLFESYDVDIVFTGHDHHYERSTSRADYVTNSHGVVYIVSGGGGQDLRTVGSSFFTAYSQSVYHTVQVQIEGCILWLRAVDTNGSMFDQTALAKCSHNFYLPLTAK